MESDFIHSGEGRRGAGAQASCPEGRLLLLTYTQQKRNPETLPEQSLRRACKSLWRFFAFKFLPLLAIITCLPLYTNLKRYLHHYILCSILYYSQDMEKNLCPWGGDWIKKWYVYAMEYYSLTFQSLDINHQPQNKILTPHREVPAREPLRISSLFPAFLLYFTLLHPAPLWRFHVCCPSLPDYGILDQKVIYN